MYRMSREVYVDVGAYVGDTIEQYIAKKAGVFAKIIGIEPDFELYTAMSYRMDRIKKEWGLEPERIELIQAGIGEKEEVLHVSNSSEKLSTKLLDDGCGQEVRVLTLDAILGKEQAVGLVKADIEGAEISLLKGAVKTLKEKAPNLAICVYHKVTDIYEIMFLIKNINNMYKFKLRHHYYNYCETVVYAYISE